MTKKRNFFKFKDGKPVGAVIYRKIMTKNNDFNNIENNSTISSNEKKRS